MSNQSYLTAEDLLKGITGESEDYEIEGLGTIQIRSLSVSEVQRIYAEAATNKKGEDHDTGKLMALALFYGLVQPKLGKNAIAKLIDGKAGPVLNAAKRIMELSGMSDEDELDSLSGGGSSE